jgi:hypothetical protein
MYISHSYCNNQEGNILIPPISVFSKASCTLNTNISYNMQCPHGNTFETQARVNVLKPHACRSMMVYYWWGVNVTWLGIKLIA